MTALTTANIAALTAIATGKEAKRAADKEAAIKRLSNAMEAAGFNTPWRRGVLVDVLNAPSMDAAEAALRQGMAMIAAADAEGAAVPAVDLFDLAKSAAEHDAEEAAAEEADRIASRRAGRRAALRVIEGSAPAAAPKPEKAKTKRQIMLDMIFRTEGATEDEICTAIGWKACLVTLRRTCDAEGVELVKVKAKGERTRYFGKRIAAALKA